ncbi:MAG TPA: leucyl/phenylalanyl-tRNA--protein transferase [Rhodanobacteraceae bacterium]|jgi:leucyl/phenylalanyl-tRNA--protein transferase|nr:leucyl/phenylalanyl-tRNA--protein transferase [Rhodanobacteraceae bacterium]
MIRLAPLRDDDPEAFPDPAQALHDPNGLLAFGGDLSSQRLVAAYSQGIFPWYSEGDPLLWWSPDPRCVFATDGVHVSRRLRRTLKKSDWTLSMDRAFSRVMRECAAPRWHESGTWITGDMLAAYTRLHELGHAHSLEVWDGGALVGGIYGVGIGRMFSAESMFSRVTDASKAALVALCRTLHGWGFPLLDAQVPNPHLQRMGAIPIPREDYLRRLRTLVAQSGPADWRLPFTYVSGLA